MIDIELITTNVMAREKARLHAVTDLADSSKHEEAMKNLLMIWMMDWKDWEEGRGPSGVFAYMDIDDLSSFSGNPESLSAFGEPWATRCAVWRADADWKGFIKNWRELHDLPVKARLQSLCADLHSRLLKEDAENGGKYLFEEEFREWIGTWSFERVLSDVLDPLKDFTDFRRRHSDSRGKDSNGPLYSPMECSEHARERVRRAAIKDLDNDELRDKAIYALKRVADFDRNHPFRDSSEVGIDELRSLINAAGEFVSDDLIAVLWSVRIDTWMGEENAQSSGYPASTWNEFIEAWVAETERVEKLLQSEPL